MVHHVQRCINMAKMATKCIVSMVTYRMEARPENVSNVCKAISIIITIIIIIVFIRVILNHCLIISL